MNKEELEKEAGEYADKHAFRVPYDGSNKFYDDVDYKASKEGYLAGAEPREKRIAELEAEIQNLEGIKLAQETALSKEYLIEEQLRKENSSLKQNKKTVAHLGNICIEVAKQMLEEAKELLKEWIICHGGTRKFHSALQDKTEVFLKKIEE